MDWKDQKVAVTGSHGMIGKELVERLIELKADVYSIDLKIGFDLTNPIICDVLTRQVDYVFHLAGIKGNPKRTKEKPIDFMEPMLKFDTNMICAAQKNNIKGFLYTSSIAVENPESDYYPAWTKMTAEKLIEAMKIQYPNGTKYCIVRPANVYGRYDNFNSEYPMVVTKLINEAIKKRKIKLDIEGCKQIRDVINAKDVANGMIQAMEEMPNYPVNLCTEKGVSIEEIVKIIESELNIPVFYENLKLVLGPDKKVMKLNWNFKPQINLEDGIKEVIKYARNDWNSS